MADNLPPSCAVVTKSGNLNFLELSGPLQVCNGDCFTFMKCISWIINYLKSLMHGVTMKNTKLWRKVWQEREIKLLVKWNFNRVTVSNPKPTYDDRESKAKIFSFRSAAFQGPVRLFDFRQIAHEIPEETVTMNCIKFECRNLHPHTRSTSVPIRYNIHVAHDCVITLWTVNRTIYFIANISQTVTNSDTKGCHSFITTKPPKLRMFLPIGWP